MEHPAHHLATETDEDVQAAAMHLEDLEIFAGQRSRTHPGPGWAVVLKLLRADLAAARAAVAARAGAGTTG